MNLMFVVSIVSAYLIGSFPTSFILARVLKGIDIRQFGSKNVGATNVFRVVGKLPAFVVLIVDILKGVLVVTVIVNFFYSFEKINYDFYRSLLGIIAIIGHIWPIFLGFKGGKGVATTLGVAGVIAPMGLLLSLIIWSIVFFLTNYVSLASIIALISLPIIATIFNYPFSTIVVTAIICLITTYKHKENINRLLRGVENKTFIFNPK